MKKRSEVDVKDTWKLEDMVPGDSQWEKLFEEASLEVKQYADFPRFTKQHLQRNTPRFGKTGRVPGQPVPVPEI